MPGQETIRLSLDLDVPITLVNTIIARHILRVLRVSSNGHAAPGHQAPPPDHRPIPAPTEEDAASALESLDDTPGQASAGAP